jgi:glucose/arabinose dehydrogenase
MRRCGWSFTALLLSSAACGPGPTGVDLGALGLLAPAAPVIHEPTAEGVVVNAADVHMEIAAVTDPDPGDTHVCTDWEIWTVAPSERVWITACIGGAEKLHTHLGDGRFERSHSGLRQLRPLTQYRLRVRVKDGSGDPASEWSAWSERGFSTAPERPPLPGAPEWIVSEPNFLVERVVGGLKLPVNIAFVPHPGAAPGDPLFYVTELYGTVKVVTNSLAVRDYAAGLLNYDPGGAFPGSGEQGLAGIVVEPATGDLFVGLLRDSGGPHFPRVLRLHSNDGGLTAATQTVVLDMPGEPQGQSHQISNLSIGPDGKLYVHMGDGFDASTGRNLASFRGKILRLELDGRPAADNPFHDARDGINARDHVWAYGLRNPFGGVWRPSTGVHYQVENGPSVDRLAAVTAGMNFGYDGTDQSMSIHALYNWSPAHAPVNIAFIDHELFHGSNFPASKLDHAFVSESGATYGNGPQDRGKRITELAFRADGSVAGPPTTLVEYNGTGRSTVAGLASGPDGLYFTSLYEDGGAGGPAARGAGVYRLRYAPPSTAPGGRGTGLRGDYFANPTVSGTPVSRLDPRVDFDWGAGAPAPGVPTNSFSVRWTGNLEPRFTEAYTFITRTDDGVRLWIDGQLVIDAWRDQAATEHAATVTLRADRLYAIRMEMYDNGGQAVARLSWQSATQPREVIPQSQLYGAAQGTGLQGEYYDDMDFTGRRFVRQDAAIDFDWGGGAPMPEMGVDSFSVRWTGSVEPRFSEPYSFTTFSDDGVRLWINGTLIIDQWSKHPASEHSGAITLTAGRRYDLRMEVYEGYGQAVARLSWASASQPRAVIPRSQLYPPPPAPPPPDPDPPPGGGTGLAAVYFDNRDLTGPQVARTDGAVDFSWGAAAPAPGIDADTFSVRWTGRLAPRFTETYTFTTTSDDGVRLWLGGQLLIDQWNNHAATDHSATVALTAGESYDLRLEMYENYGNAVARLSWASPSQPREIVPRSATTHPRSASTHPRSIGGGPGGDHGVDLADVLDGKTRPSGGIQPPPGTSGGGRSSVVVNPTTGGDSQRRVRPRPRPCTWPAASSARSDRCTVR